jgi:catechol 2,3-dioxygenase-like lactoylglutathione lyase family enzyme
VSERSFSHVGVVVPDLEEARIRFGELLGLEWGPVREISFEARDGHGERLSVALRICLSMLEPGFELIEEAPGTPWVRKVDSNLHHIAFSSGDLATDSDRMLASSCPLQITMGGEGVRPGSSHTIAILSV